jgi:hypothetical protein
MARWHGKTTERGYDGSHATERKRRVAVYRLGDPCAIGGEPLHLPPGMLDLAHDHVNGGYLPGLACRYHNRQEGAQRGNRSRQFTPAAAGSNVICRVCGKPYTRAARVCEICSSHYHPTYGEQRTCSRTCGIELRRRNGNFGAGADMRRKNWPSSPVYAKDCAHCGKLFVGRKSDALYCSQQCRRRSETAISRPVIGMGSCEQCGQAFEVKESGRRRRWCSAVCGYRARQEWVTSRRW